MDKETYTFEDRMYVNPTTSRDEQLRFVDNLRAIQAEDAARIARDTHNLGTDVTSNLGGLNGSEGIWSQQHVDPQVNSMVASLRATAQAQALNDVLSNMQNQAKERYNRAYRAAQRRAHPRREEVQHRTYLRARLGPEHALRRSPGGAWNGP